MDLIGSPLSVTGSPNKDVGTRHTITRRENALGRGFERLGVDHQSLPFCSLDFGRSLHELEIHRLADGGDDNVTVDAEFRTGNGNRPPSAALIRFTQFHANAFRANNLPLLGQHLHGVAQKVEFHLLFFCIPDFYIVGRHLLAGSSVNQIHIGLSDSKRRAHAVDSHIAATDDDDLLALWVGVLSLIDLEQVSDSWNKALVTRVFPLYSHGCVGLGSHTDEYGPVILGNLFQGNVFPDFNVIPDLDAHLLNDVHFPVENVSGQAVIRNPPGRHSP